ncbi:MAG: methyltransferase domain-containing protein [Pseudomonadota bacterium]
MRPDAQQLESGRMETLTIENYPWFHERHRLFPGIFAGRNHRRIIDVSAGIGVVAKRITDSYPCSLTCNEQDRTCLNQLKRLPVRVISFDLDSGERFPLEDESFDAVICLATLEHLVHLDHFVMELKRIMANNGRLYFSVPNYASLYWMMPLLRGKTFHDPFGKRSRYEFYAHIRYFTYHTVVEFLSHFGFVIDTVYLPLPKGSTRFQTIRRQSKTLAFLIQNSFRLLYCLSPRWHQEPVICFAGEGYPGKPRKVIL